MLNMGKGENITLKKEQQAQNKTYTDKDTTDRLKRLHCATTQSKR